MLDKSKNLCYNAMRKTKQSVCPLSPQDLVPMG